MASWPAWITALGAAGWMVAALLHGGQPEWLSCGAILGGTALAALPGRNPWPRALGLALAGAGFSLPTWSYRSAAGVWMAPWLVVAGAFAVAGATSVLRWPTARKVCFAAAAGGAVWILVEGVLGGAWMWVPGGALLAAGLALSAVMTEPSGGARPIRNTASR